MSDDIVKRLRDIDDWYRAREGEGISLYSEAAVEIERLRAELAAERAWVKELTEEMKERHDEFAAYRIDVNDRITKLREALERAVVRIKSLQGHDIIDPAIRAVLAEIKDTN
jgi:hypothetical protein